MNQDNFEILIIEDEKFLINPLEITFKKNKWHLTVATNGEDGIISAKKSKPDLILLDLILPKMDGYEVLKILKSDPETKDIPVLIVSNLAREAEIRRGIAGGAADYIVKANFSMQGLLEKIKQYLNGR